MISSSIHDVITHEIIHVEWRTRSMMVEAFYPNQRISSTKFEPVERITHEVLWKASKQIATIEDKKVINVLSCDDVVQQQ